MRRPIRLLAVPVAVLAAGALAPFAGAVGAAALPPPVTPPAAGAPTPPAAGAPTPPAGTPVAGHMKLELQRVGGLPLFALMGKRIVLRGVVTPYVAGQSVKVSFYREARRIEVRIVSVQPMRGGSGQFRISFSSRDAGLLQAPAPLPWRKAEIRALADTFGLPE